MYQVGTKNMRIEKIAGAASNMRKGAGAPASATGAERPESDDRASEGANSRALIALDTPQAPPRGSGTRHSAPFLAQLLANRIGVPQTRARRRALPADGSARYAAAGSLSCAPRIGITDRRSI